MLSSARVYRDPVHDIISFKEEGVLGRIVATLVDTREVQRLRSVRQLGLASLVFHGAEHSRFQHSLGVAHLARRMADRLGHTVGEERRMEVVLASLLHDVGHAPFSHVMERVFDFHHETYSHDIVTHPDSEVRRVLASVDKDLPDRVARRIAGGAGDFADAIVSSQLDADRLDYLLRDAHMTGVGVGRYDLERILLLLGHDDEGLTVERGGHESIEGYLVARYHMYRLVYFHRTVRAAEAMLQALFARARALLLDGRDEIAPDHALGRCMRGESVDPVSWAGIGDHHAWSLIERWRTDDDPVLALLADGLLRRRLFKAMERPLDAQGALEQDDQLVERVREALAPNEQYLLRIDDAGDTPYRPYTPGDHHGLAGAIRIRGRDGHIERIEARSPIAAALARAAYRFRRWYVHPSIMSKVQHVAGPDLLAPRAHP